eukprot:g5009.t1
MTFKFQGVDFFKVVELRVSHCYHCGCWEAIKFSTRERHMCTRIMALQLALILLLEVAVRSVDSAPVVQAIVIVVRVIAQYVFPYAGRAAGNTVAAEAINTGRGLQVVGGVTAGAALAGGGGYAGYQALSAHCTDCPGPKRRRLASEAANAVVPSVDQAKSTVVSVDPASSSLVNFVEGIAGDEERHQNDEILDPEGIGKMLEELCSNFTNNFESFRNFSYFSDCNNGIVDVTVEFDKTHIYVWLESGSEPNCSYVCESILWLGSSFSAVRNFQSIACAVVSAPDFGNPLNNYTTRLPPREQRRPLAARMPSQDCSDPTQLFYFAGTTRIEEVFFQLCNTVPPSFYNAFSSNCARMLIKLVYNLNIIQDYSDFLAFAFDALTCDPEGVAIFSEIINTTTSAGYPSTPAEYAADVCMAIDATNYNPSSVANNAYFYQSNRTLRFSLKYRNAITNYVSGIPTEIYFDFSLANNLDFVVSNIVLSSSLPADFVCVPAVKTLSPGEVIMCRARYIITQVDAVAGALTMGVFASSKGKYPSSLLNLLSNCLPFQINFQPTSPTVTPPSKKGKGGQKKGKSKGKYHKQKKLNKDSRKLV